MADPWLFLEEVADELRTSIGTVRYWVKAGKIRSYRPGRRRMVRRSDLEAFVARSVTVDKEGRPADPQPVTDDHGGAGRPTPK